jgi:ubiquinone/menaquinone biosynthesis C-methylase UbiE
MASSGARRSFKPALRFDVLTPLFDPVVALTTRERSSKSRVLERARLQDGDTVLDVGCGTGTLAIAAASSGVAVTVVGLDADPVVLRRARSKAEAAGAEISFDEAFSTEMPYADSHFDVVLTTLFFHHLRDDDKRRTITQILRVLKPGGRLVVADVGRPQDPLMRLAVLTTVQLLDGRETTSANVAGKLPGLLEDEGFAEVAVRDRLRTLTGTIEILTTERQS